MYRSVYVIAILRQSHDLEASLWPKPAKQATSRDRQGKEAGVGNREQLLVIRRAALTLRHSNLRSRVIVVQIRHIPNLVV